MPVLKDASTVDLEEYFSKLRKISEKALSEEEQKFSRFKSMKFVEARYLGQSYDIQIPYRKNNFRTVEKEFNLRHKELYGYSSQDKVEIVNVKLRVVIPSKKPELSKKWQGHQDHKLLKKTNNRTEGKRRRAWFSNRYYEALVFERDELSIGIAGEGPCIIEEYDSTAVINPNWLWKVDGYGNLILNWMRKEKWRTR